MPECIRPVDLRRRTTEIAKRVARSGESVPIGTTIGRLRYVLRPATRPDGQGGCVELGPDEMRQNFTEILALVRLEGIPFGIRVDGQLLAVLVRHTEYGPDAADRYRKAFRLQGGGTAASATLENRIAVLEMALTAIGDRLAKLEGCLPDADARNRT